VAEQVRVSKHKPCVIWQTRLDGKGPYQWTQTASKSDVWIGFMPGNKEPGFKVRMSRRDARLLAKRITQCLDDTA